MTERITPEDYALLEELAIEIQPAAQPGMSAREQRVIAGFEDVLQWVEKNGRLPQHDKNGDIFERIYAARLDRLRASFEFRDLLAGLDAQGILRGNTPVVYRVEEAAVLEDAALLAELGVSSASDGDITLLTHVRSRVEINAAEDVAKRKPCHNFEEFRQLFDCIQHDLQSGARQTSPYKDDAGVAENDLFILEGQKIIVASAGEKFVSGYGRPDRRLRVVYDNGTESDLLLRSLQRALNKDKTSRRISVPDLGPLFSEVEEADDVATGFVYVLESKSDHSFVAQNRTVIHKIGVTGGDVQKRIANARKDPTYLLADVEIVATYQLANINRKRLENLLHKFFNPARLDMELKDRFGSQVEPREWYLVPLPVIEEAIEKLKQGTLENCFYDCLNVQIVEVVKEH